MDAQELLLNEKGLQHLGRIWQDVASFSDFMETLRRNPAVVSGKRVKDEQEADVLLLGALWFSVTVRRKEACPVTYLIAHDKADRKL